MQPGTVWDLTNAKTETYSLLEPEVAALLREIVQVNAAIVALNATIIEALQLAKYPLQQSTSKDQK